MTSEHESESAVSRRAVIRGAAVSGVALPLLAACGGGGASASGSGSGGSGSSGGKVTLPESEVPVGGGKILAADQVVVTQPTKGTFKAFSAICTHQACVAGAD